MKNTSTLIVLLFGFLSVMVSGQVFGQTYAENFNSYNNTAETLPYGYSFTNSTLSTTDAIDGTSVNLGAGSFSSAFYQTGFFLLSGNNNLSFQHKVTSIATNPSVIVQLISYTGSATILHSHNYTNTNTITTNIPINNYNGWFRLRFFYLGVNNSVRGVIDNFTSSIPVTLTGSSTRLGDIQIATNTDWPLYFPSEKVELSLTITNNGPNIAEDVQVQVSMPSGHPIISYTAASGVVFNDQTGELTIANLPIGASRSLSITTEAAGLGIYSFGASFSGFNFMEDPLLVNNQSQSQFFVEMGPLPVVLNDLKAAAIKPETALITWQTLSEKNASHFEVEGSIDGANFQYLGTLKASGNSYSINKYEFQAETTHRYFRLKMVDLDGSSEYSAIVNTGSQNIGSTLKIATYPNPVTDWVTLSLNKANSNSEATSVIEIFSLNGLALQLPQQKNGQETTLNVSTLPKGTYLVKAFVDGEQLLGSFVK